MSNQTLLTGRPAQWKKDRSDLERDRQSHWAYIATVLRICDSGTYLEAYETQEKFLKEETGFGTSYLSRLRTACQTRQTLLTIGNPPSNESALREIAKIKDKKLQKQVFAEVSQKCEAEGREPVTKDYQKAAKPYIPPKPETNGKPKADKPADREVGDEPEEPDSCIVKDDIERDVPQNLREKHGLKPAIVACGNKLNAIIREVEELSDSPGGEFIQFAVIKQHLKDAKGLVQDAAYYTECPDCKGKKCSRCEGGVGFIPKRMRNMLSDAEKGWLGI